eukprot:m.164974 g.164974  ORF g.164974 m.164974 type:complete len:247 (+) comp14415_c0_seq2:2610-3350(+)
MIMIASPSIRHTSMVVHLTVAALVAAALQLSVPVHSQGLGDWPPAPHSGGKACNIDAQCGIPAANCPSLRRKCASLTGSCISGRCMCAANMYGCPNCHAKATLVRNTTDVSQFYYTTEQPLLNGSASSVNICTAPQGGGACSADTDCGTLGGLCLDKTCVCPDGWMCSYCTLQLNDLLYGVGCDVQSGGGKCQSDKDCHHGSCIPSVPGLPSSPKYCHCDPLYACAFCDKDVINLSKRNASCNTAT